MHVLSIALAIFGPNKRGAEPTADKLKSFVDLLVFVFIKIIRQENYNHQRSQIISIKIFRSVVGRCTLLRQIYDVCLCEGKVGGEEKVLLNIRIWNIRRERQTRSHATHTTCRIVQSFFFFSNQLIHQTMCREFTHCGYHIAHAHSYNHTDSICKTCARSGADDQRHNNMCIPLMIILLASIVCNSFLINNKIMM